MKEEKKVNQAIDQMDFLDMANACSTTDCTGLIQAAPTTKEEYESYKEIYDFEPPNVKTRRKK